MKENIAIVLLLLASLVIYVVADRWDQRRVKRMLDRKYLIGKYGGNE